MDGRTAFGLTVAAFAYSVALFAAGIPMLAEESSFVLVVLAVPAAVAAAVWFLLHRRCTAGGGTTIATGLVGLLLVFSVLGLATIGLFVLPVVVMLAVATSLTPSPAG